jgi:hypothetical protein
MTWQWLNARISSLPLILAGPILRRVTPDLVSVWVATQTAQDILLTVHDGATQAPHRWPPTRQQVSRAGRARSSWATICSSLC